MSIVNVVAAIAAKPGQEQRVEDILKGLVRPSRQDKGCILYDLHKDLDNPGVFVFYEAWESREMLEAHLNAPHLLAWREKAPELAASMDVKVLEKLS